MKLQSKMEVLLATVTDRTQYETQTTNETHEGDLKNITGVLNVLNSEQHRLFVLRG